MTVFCLIILSTFQKKKGDISFNDQIFKIKNLG